MTTDERKALKIRAVLLFGVSFHEVTDEQMEQAKEDQAFEREYFSGYHKFEVSFIGRLRGSTGVFDQKLMYLNAPNILEAEREVRKDYEIYCRLIITNVKTRVSTSVELA